MHMGGVHVIKLLFIFLLLFCLFVTGASRQRIHMMWFAGCIILPVVLGAPDILEPLLAVAENPAG